MITETDDDLASIPGMPPEDELRADLLRTGDVPYWRPFGEPDGSATDFASLPPELAEKTLQARLLAGPGPKGSPFQWAMFEHYQRIAELEKEQARLTEQLTAVREFDRDTGEGISALTPEQSQAMGYRLLQVQDELKRAQRRGRQGGPPQEAGCGCQD